MCQSVVFVNRFVQIDKKFLIVLSILIYGYNTNTLTFYFVFKAIGLVFKGWKTKFGLNAISSFENILYQYHSGRENEINRG